MEREKMEAERQERERMRLERERRERERIEREREEQRRLEQLRYGFVLTQCTSVWLCGTFDISGCHHLMNVIPQK